MSILIDQETKLIVQGITGKEGLFHTERMLQAGTNIVAGVTPGKGGEWVLDGKIPIFDNVRNAAETTGGNASVLFVPFHSAADAILESTDAGMHLIACITEGIPIYDMLLVKSYLVNTNSRLIGPNSPGLLSPGKCNVGIIPEGLVNDPHTEKIVLIGEIGGCDEERTAEYISKYLTKPVVAYIAGITAPPDRRMGHAGAIVEGRAGSAQEKISTFKDFGIKVSSYSEEIPALLK
jgi:succinyl-CoA synthetase alpha subunit